MLQIVKNKTSVLILTLLFWSNFIFAQDDPGGLDGGDPGNAVPINDWIPYVLLITIAIAFYFMYKKKAVSA